MLGAAGGNSGLYDPSLTYVGGAPARTVTVGQGRNATTAEVPATLGTPTFSSLADLFSADISAGEQSQLETIRGLAGISDAENAALTNLTETLQGRFLNPNDPTLLSYIEAAQRPIREQGAEAERSARATFTRAGQNIQSSSPYAAAYADLQGSLFNSLKDTAAQILFPAFQNERQNQIAAAQLAPNIMASIAERNLRVLEAEGLPRLVEQGGIDNALQELDSQRAAVAQALATAAGLAAPVTGSSSRSRQGGILSG